MSNVVCTKVLHQAYNTLGHILQKIKSEKSLKWQKNGKMAKNWQKVTQQSCQKWFLNFQNFYASESCVRFNFVFFTAPVGGSIGHPNILHSPICGAGSEYSASQDWTAVQVVSSFGTGN